MPDFYIVSSFFYKKSKQARVPTFVCLFCDDATTTKVLHVTKEQINVYAFRGSSGDAHPCRGKVSFSYNFVYV